MNPMTSHSGGVPICPVIASLAPRDVAIQLGRVLNMSLRGGPRSGPTKQSSWITTARSAGLVMTDILKHALDGLLRRALRATPRNDKSGHYPLFQVLRATLTCVSLVLALAGNAVAADAAKKPVTQTTFATPEAASKALVAASEPFDTAALAQILGADGVDLVISGDSVQDKTQSAAFAAKAHEKVEVIRDPANPNLATLTIGDDAWPMPIPLVQQDGKWRFDTAAGRQEIIFRRVGENELCAIQMCLGFVEAQHDYASQKRNGSDINQYAQRIISTPGKQDGLAWLDADGTWQGPVGHEIAASIAEGYTDKREPYRGYYFKVLKGQGPAAPMGEMDFMVKGVMIGGFALVAAPAKYGVTGVKTFIVSLSGIVYEKDLGEDTLVQFQAMEKYNPDPTWTAVSEQ